MTIVTYTPYCTATISGVAVDTMNLRGARVETSFADPVSKGYIKCLTDPGFSQGDDVTITLGNGVNNLTRFHGTVLQGDWLNTGPAFEIVCRGPLFGAQKYRNNRPKGILLQDLTGGPATDEAIARAVLSMCGVSYSSSNIGGTGIVRGALAPKAYTWKQGETGLDYLHRLTKASLGYKVVESPEDNNNVYRVQVLSQPGGGAEFTLTQGIDIFEGGHTQKSTFETFSAWQVTGFDYGTSGGSALDLILGPTSASGPTSFSVPSPIPDGVISYAYASDMIERARNADTGGGISCETVLGYVQNETDHTIVKLSGLSTPRDDLFGPGQVHHITADWLGLDQNLTCIAVTTEVDENWFTQTMEYVG